MSNVLHVRLSLALRGRHFALDLFDPSWDYEWHFRLVAAFMTHLTRSSGMMKP